MYSRKQSINMAINHQSYDIIICCRFDMSLRLKLPPNMINPTKLVIPDYNTINSKCLYMSNWQHLHSGYSDHWFFSEPKIMQIIANMYDHLN